jgi:hypothetical protein
MTSRGKSVLLGGALLSAVACSSEAPLAPSATVSVHVPTVQEAQTTTTCSPDKTPPTITAVSATPNTLWPPNHKMRRVTINYSASDSCGAVTCSLRVSSNEPVNDIGDGNTAPDWVVLDARHVQLRAERQGPRNGRVYTVTISCTDAARNTSTASTSVRVPHDQR